MSVSQANKIEDSIIVFDDRSTVIKCLTWIFASLSFTLFFVSLYPIIYGRTFTWAVLTTTLVIISLYSLRILYQNRLTISSRGIKVGKGSLYSFDEIQLITDLEQFEGLNVLSFSLVLTPKPGSERKSRIIDLSRFGSNMIDLLFQNLKSDVENIEMNNWIVESDTGAFTQN